MNNKIFSNFYKLALLINNDSSGKDILIAYKENIFFITEDMMQESHVENLSEEDLQLFNKIVESIPINSSQSNSHLTESPHSYFNYIIETRSEIIVAKFSSINNKNYLGILNTMPFNASSSQYIKKIQKQLDIKKISYLTMDDDGEYNELFHYNESEMPGKLPKELYHGTNLRYAKNIVGEGLKPMPNQTNFAELKHSDTVFLTSDIEKAKSHAEVASIVFANQGSHGRRVPNFGIIFKFKIPDESKLVPDFDVKNRAEENNLDPFKQSKEIGFVGYKGRIPASFILEIFFVNKDGSLKKISKEELLELDENKYYPSEFEEDGDYDENY